MYLIYLILCDIPLILASNNYYYVSESFLPPVPSELELEFKSLVNIDRTKRDAGSVEHSISATSHPPELQHPPIHDLPSKNDNTTNSSHPNNVITNTVLNNTTTSSTNKINVYNTLNNATNVTAQRARASAQPDIYMQSYYNYTGVLPDLTNEDLKQHNITKTREDSHIYYNSTRTDDPEIGKHYWVDMNNRPDVTNHSMLSHSHRRAVTVTLPFKFQFYGHEIENVTIATGGFLYTGDYIHSWLAATQYIAPLMANFDTSLSNDSNIKYVYNNTAFTVLWENVSLQDQPNSGNFTFEVTLKSNGDIIFVYQHIPNITAELTDHFHPVKIGLSDAYIMDRTIFFVRRKTIFEYHRVQFDKKELKNGTVIYLRPLPTCQNKNTCESCLAKDVGFDCQWCDNRCSNGFDRRRHEWIKKECDKKRINETRYCSLANEKIPTPGAHKAMNYNEEMPSSSSKSVIFLTIVTIGCVLSIFVWTLYAYRNPHSTSGQILIRYRPSQWSGWRKGEARYTAATIHM